MVLFEQRYRGHLWRLEIADHAGRRFGNWRRWFLNDEGEWQATRQGCTIPLERLEELQDGLRAYLGRDAPEGPAQAA